MSFFENLEKLCEKTKYLEIDIKKQLKELIPPKKNIKSSNYQNHGFNSNCLSLF